ncbi:type III secretion system ATPase SctN [Hafnia paralvei]|uniref:type III secretion system ATPase SctN n=1 Tax=Hafnia paralvei TaxID=546367 RepID=UPI003AB4E193
MSNMDSKLSDYFLDAAHPIRIQGNIIEANLPATSIGELCDIYRSLNDSVWVGNAVVIGFNEKTTILSLLCECTGFSQQHLLVPTGKSFEISLSEELSGCIVNSLGVVVGRLDGREPEALRGVEKRDVNQHAVNVSERRTISERLTTGVRAIDGLLTCGQGQRIGIFAAAGCGKTSLMNMLIEHAEADIYVIGLIGERGREVTEFIEHLQNSAQRERTILVYATSDSSSVERCNAAAVATSIAEFFRDRGKNVVLFIDSVTRYARALRDVALSMGELPARRGYPASVFEMLPSLLERPGCTRHGVITAFYTVLLENEEEPDVIGEEVRSILDGHIYLRKSLAAREHYPAIDVLNSLSRLFPKVTDREHQHLAQRFRELMACQQELQMLIDLGEYRPGLNKKNDFAVEKKLAMENFLRQQPDEFDDFFTMQNKLKESVS